MYYRDRRRNRSIGKGRKYALCRWENTRSSKVCNIISKVVAEGRRLPFPLVTYLNLCAVSSLKNFILLVMEAHTGKKIMWKVIDFFLISPTESKQGESLSDVYLSMVQCKKRSNF